MDEEPVQPVNENKEASTDAQKPDDKPPVVPVDVGNVDSEEHANAPATDNKKRKRKPLSCFEIWTIVLASLGILVAGGTGLAIYWQAKISYETLGEIKKQYPELQKSANAADRAASDSGQSLNDSIDEFRVEHRAWVALSEIKFDRYGTNGLPEEIRLMQFRPNDTIFINVILKNIGSTPAFHVCPKFSTKPALASEGEPNFQPLRPEAECNPSIMEPGMSHFQTLKWSTLPEQALSDIRSDRVVVFLHGKVEYRDAFKIDHWIKVCSFLLSGGAWAACKNGNELDDNPELPPAPSPK